MIFIKKVLRVILRIIRIYFGVVLGMAAFGFIILTPQAETNMGVCNIVLSVLCIFGSVLLLKKPKKNSTPETHTATAQGEAVAVQTEYAPSEIPDDIAKDMRKYYTLMQAQRDAEIMAESYRLASTTTNLDTFCMRYDLTLQKAHTLLQAEQIGVKGIKKLNCHNACVSIIEAAPSLKLRALHDYAESEFYSINVLKTSKGKCNRYIKMLMTLERAEPTFMFMDEYNALIDEVKKRINGLDGSFSTQAEHIDNSPSYSDEDVEQPAYAYVFDKDGKFLCRADGENINDADVSNLIRYGYERAKQEEKASSNPKFHRTVEEHDLIYNFMEKHGAKSAQMCDSFESLNQMSFKASDIDEKILYLQKAIQAFEEAKTWHYNYSKGGKLYFQDFWEHLHNSRHECFSWVDSVQNNLDALIQMRDLIIPWILEKAEFGFKQTEIYKEFPNVEQSQLRGIIDDLCSDKKISKIKKGNTYWISSNIRSEETSYI